MSRKRIEKLKGRKRQIEVCVYAIERAGLMDGDVVWHKRVCLVKNDPKAPAIASQIGEMINAFGGEMVDEVLKLVKAKFKKGAKKK